MTDPAGWRPGTLGAFSRGGGSPTPSYQLIFVSWSWLLFLLFLFCRWCLPLSGVWKLLPSPFVQLGRWEWGQERRGGHLCFQCQEKPQGELCSCSGTNRCTLGGSLIICFPPPAHQMLPQFPGCPVRSCCFPCGTSLQQHTFQRGAVGSSQGLGAPALSHGPQQWQQGAGVGHS